jgi:hypothetical protein
MEDLHIFEVNKVVDFDRCVLHLDQDQRTDGVGDKLVPGTSALRRTSISVNLAPQSLATVVNMAKLCEEVQAIITMTGCVPNAVQCEL